MDRPAVPKPASEAIREAGLRYGTDRQAGIRRRRARQGFAYSATDNRRLARATRDRIRQLVIPPAWTDVWISADPLSHLQAIGRDAKGRKQYRYHARWAAVRGQHKFDRLLQFADALPAIRRRVRAEVEPDCCRAPAMAKLYIENNAPDFRKRTFRRLRDTYV